MTDTSKLLWLTGTHLYHPETGVAAYPSTDTPVLMIEDDRLCRRYHYHQQKIALVLASMRNHAEHLRQTGFDVTYHRRSNKATKRSSIRHILEQTLSQGNYSHLVTFPFADKAGNALCEQVCQKAGVEWERLAEPGFLTTPDDFLQWHNGRKTLRMGEFYKYQRRRLELLMTDQGQPVGGKWSFDEDNRKKFPKKSAPPLLAYVEHNAVTQATIEEVKSDFSNFPGDAQQLWLPTTHQQAQVALQQFVTERLRGFGTYEDAITQRSATLFHSTLSPLINIGLLTPQEVVAAAVTQGEKDNTPLNDVEGFVRQVIGWREFIRGVYDLHGDEMRSSNVRSAQRHLSDHWWRADTGIPPLDGALNNMLRLGWNHHIERLMVIANLMNLSEIEPQEVFDFFMSGYVDAYDWVMVPNVFGMGLTSEGGVFATKPYIAGSNYLLKMSDYPKGSWCDVVDGLYWRFVASNKDELSANPRLGFFTKGLERLDPERRDRIFAAADSFLERCAPLTAP